MDVPARLSHDVLAQPTRARLFALLGELRRPASTEELAAQLAMHPNGVRLHLERLREAQLVVRERQRQARGRPRDSWSISADAQPGGDPPSAYADLGRWLVRAMVQSTTGVGDIETAGRQIGRELASTGGGAPAEERFHSALAAMGFAPRRDLTPDGTLTYCLDNCPYRDVVGERQSLICGLHRGLTRGMLDTVSPETELVGFVAKDPYAAGCLIELRGPLAEEAAARRDGGLAA
jgi:predicted ArsR family transcriptional regulator